MSGHDNIVGIKEASGDMTQIIEILAGKPDDFLMISGDDMLSLAMVAMGGIGVISVLANALPHDMSEMIRLALSGDYVRANQLLYKLSRINPLMYEESSPVGVKQLMAEKGICKNYVRLPLVSASEKLTEKIRASI